MGLELEPLPVQFFCALLGSSAEHLQIAYTALKKKFPQAEWMGNPFPFVGTSYYENEIGNSPWRGFVKLDGLKPREQMVEIKKWTNQLELKLFEGPRLVNFDPGYLTPGQVFLATTKDQRHRVYLSEGIFAEVTLYFEGKSCGHFPWTYYDWQSEIYKERFKTLRAQHKAELKNWINAPRPLTK